MFRPRFHTHCVDVPCDVRTCDPLPWTFIAIGSCPRTLYSARIYLLSPHTESSSVCICASRHSASELTSRSWIFGTLLSLSYLLRYPATGPYDAVCWPTQSRISRDASGRLGWQVVYTLLSVCTSVHCRHYVVSHLIIC